MDIVKTNLFDLLNTVIEVPTCKIVAVPDNQVIHIDDEIFGTLRIRLLNDKNGFVEDNNINVSGYSGEHGCFVTVPKSWVDKKALITYTRRIKTNLPLSIDGENYSASLDENGLDISYCDEDHRFFAYIPLAQFIKDMEDKL